MANIKLIIEREYNERVRKKSFIITTILMPVVMALLCLAPTLILFFGGSETKTIEVVDQSGVIFEKLESNKNVEFVRSELTATEAKNASEQGENFGVLVLGENIVTDPSEATLYTWSASSISLEESISSAIEGVIEAERLKGYPIDNLQEIMESIEAKVTISAVRSDKQEGESSSATMAMAIGYILGVILYMFLFIYGSMVMSSVIEEKSSRVLDVLVSSVRPFDLLMGKITGIALVAITQIAIWGVLTFAILAFALPALLPSDIMESVGAIQAGGAMMPEMDNAEMIGIISSLTDLGYISELMLYALLFLMGGYLLYSAMFAAVGSAFDTVEDAQSLQTIVVAPIILAFFVMMMIAEDPNSLLVKIFSIVPFTSPIIMMARIPHSIPTWEIVTSLLLLYATFVAMVVVASKIYRVGIFMHGKKPTLKELWHWTKYKF